MIAKDFPKGISLSRMTLRNSISSTIAGTTADETNSKTSPPKWCGISGEYLIKPIPILLKRSCIIFVIFAPTDIQPIAVMPSKINFFGKTNLKLILQLVFSVYLKIKNAGRRNIIK